LQIVQGLRDSALDYAAAGLPVVPCRGKQPITPHGLYDATTDELQIRRWWKELPGANVAIRCGIGCDVVDVESPAGVEALTEAASPYRLGWGWIAQTGKGFHYYLAPGGHRSRSAILPDVEFRGRNALVVAPPSRHPNGRQYRWVRGVAFGEVDLQPPPEWLAMLIEPVRLVTRLPRRWQIAPPEGDRARRYARAALVGEAHAVADAAKGCRNRTLNLAAWRMRRFVEAGQLDEGEVVDLLVRAAESCGLELREIARTIASGLGTGRSR
jgi:hypothetical protein